MSKSSLGESVVQKTVMEVPVRFLSSSSKGGSDWMTVKGRGGVRGCEWGARGWWGGERMTVKGGGVRGWWGSDWMTVRGGGGERMLVGRRFVVLFCRL